METDTAKLAFLKALNKVQGLLEPAKKDSLNPHFKSRYASLASVNEAVMGPISEAGFVLLSGGVDINGVPHLRTTLYHIGGHSESFDYPLIKVTENPQHVASSFTYARRYSICALFNLSTEDDDGNAATESVKTTTRAAATPAGEVNVVKFVPAKVSSKTVKKKDGSEGTAFEITAPDGAVYSTWSELFSAFASTAKANGTEVVVGFKVNGRYLQIIKLAANELPKEAEEVPF